MAFTAYIENGFRQVGYDEAVLMDVGTMFMIHRPASESSVADVSYYIVILGDDLYTNAKRLIQINGPHFSNITLVKKDIFGGKTMQILPQGSKFTWEQT